MGMFNCNVFRNFTGRKVLVSNTWTVVRRLVWAGHMVRMSDDRTIKKVFLGKPDGRRKAGRPKLRWTVLRMI